MFLIFNYFDENSSWSSYCDSNSELNFEDHVVEWFATICLYSDHCWNYSTIGVDTRQSARNISML